MATLIVALIFIFILLPLFLEVAISIITIFFMLILYSLVFTCKIYKNLRSLSWA
jgi:hypothetical protein